CSSNSARVFELFGGDDRAAKHDYSRLDWSNIFRAAHYALSHAAPGAPWIARARRMAMLARAGRRAAAELVASRCERGADIVMKLGLGIGTAEAGRSLDEHWDGGGQPRGLSGSEIPLLSRIACLAQVIEQYLVSESVGVALAVARRRRGRWFDPLLVDALPGL